jgi:probable rRNA maturation factor
MLRVRVQRSPALRAAYPRLPGALGATHLLPRMKNAVLATLEDGDVRDSSMSVTLLTDEEISSLNRDYLEHEGATDVISFALHEHGEPPVGDVYIGFARALEQAAEHGVEPAQELLRLAIHGTLHVLGHDHPAGDARVHSAMWKRQEALLHTLLSAEAATARPRPS